MGIGHNRADLQAIAEAKLSDATFLLQNGRISNAYYLAGYAVEIALKAAIAASVVAETIPHKEFLKKILSHELKNLVGLAGLAEQLKEKEAADQDFATNWAIVSEWLPDSRYEQPDAMSTQLLIQAISDPDHGVMAWIRTHW